MTHSYLTSVRLFKLLKTRGKFFCCIGQVCPPSNENITVISGSTARLKWVIKWNPSEASLAWYFTRRRVGSKEERIASKFRNRDAVIDNSSSLPGVAIETPATLILKNVDERYNGKYRFSAHVTAAIANGQVDLFIAGKF